MKITTGDISILIISLPGLSSYIFKFRRKYKLGDNITPNELLMNLVAPMNSKGVSVSDGNIFVTGTFMI